ncbi:hypothetical protein [Amycolatopsis sp. NPDC049159]|uniref:phage tail protein n=1 Tax=Amycolatopsis sp. NPDC049159 TaxID=3157210 RepID=UPI0033DF19FB
MTTTAQAAASTPVTVKERPPRRKSVPLPPSNAAALAALRAGDKKELADPSRKESQDKVGNGAVAASLARGPGADPKFAVLKKDIAHKKHTVARSHPPASKEAGSAQAASVPPKDDEVAQGKTANAEKMNEAKPKDFDKDAFVKAVEKAIAEKAPQNLEQADEFADSGKPAEIKAEVQGKVGEGKSDSAAQIADTTAAPPDTSAAETKQVVPMAADRPPGTPATPDPAKATPDKLPPSATDLSAGPAKVDQVMADNHVTDKQLTTDPAFTPALQDKKTAEKHSEATPPELRKDETKQLRQTTAQAKGFGAAAMGTIAERRRRTGRQVGGGKDATKTSDQDKRAEVTARLQKVFDTMKTEVEGILTGLDKLVDDQFTRGEKEARDAFTAEHRRKMDDYKAKRYGGTWGLIKWGHDKLFGLPDEANQIFVEARDNYVKQMREVISAVADTIGRELTRAKQRIAKGRDELQAEVKALPKDLQALGKEAAAGFADKFDELTQSVDDKSTELVDTLATKYTDAVKAVDDEIAAEKEKNKGLVDKALDGIKGVIKTILELKDMLLGVLAKAAQAVMAILKDPIGFLGNLVSAVGGGLKQFMGNAKTHLQQGVLSWLLGTAATAGIELPKSFDIVSILLLIASLIGLTWPNIRARIAKKVPKEAMSAIEAGEHALPIVMEVRKRGVRALWDDLKAKVGDLKKNLIDNLVSYLLPTIVMAGITWIVSLFNPASAFIRACKMIIDIIKFIVTNGRRIIEFVNTVLDAVIAIAKGGTGGVSGLVEKALARSIPVLIGALAALLGIGGIAGKIKEIFQKLARPVNKAIDWVIDKIVGLAKKVWAKVKALTKKLTDKLKSAAKKGQAKLKAAGKKLKDKLKRAGKKVRDKVKGAARRIKDKFNRKKKPRRDKRSPQDLQRALDAALLEATALLDAKSATVESVRRGLPPIKKRHGLTSIRLEHGPEKSYFVELAINPRKRTKPKKFTEEEYAKKFPYKIGEAERPIDIDRVPPVIDTLHRILIPMRGRDPVTGFVVTMSATPGEVLAQPNIAARYLVDAWQGPGGDNLAAARTAVIIGVNTLERLDPTKAADERNQVGAAVRKIRVPEELLAAAFGFVWTPAWRHVKEKRRAPMSEVRQAYAGLTKDEKEQAVARNETRWQEDHKLPYGVFHEVGFLSGFTQRAVELLGKVNQQVYAVSQDPDTDVVTHEGMGFLRVYDQVLRDAANDPILVIGGYHFEGFDWGPLAGSRTAQLTVLANRIDHAMKIAIGKVYPQLLYPAEPNMLIKVWERDTSRQIKLLFQDTRHLAVLRAAENQGMLWGIGAGEGRHIGEVLRERHGVSVLHVPAAALTTSPLPEVPTRGLTMTPEDVRIFASPDGHPDHPTMPRHPVYGAIMQSQTVLIARRLAKAFAQTHPLDDAARRRLETRVLTHAEAVARMMADNPGLTAHSQAIVNRLAELDADVEALLAETGGNRRDADTIKAAKLVTREMITTMTAEDLKKHWRQLSALLGDIMRDAPPSQGGPR